MIDIVKAVTDAVGTPVTVKTRLGWDCNNIIIEQLAPLLQQQGIKALTIHGRTRSQMYTGSADWQPIGRVKRNPEIHIPIIGNGDIDCAQKAIDAFEQYGVDAIMRGRASFGRPWIFKEIHDALHPDSPIDTSNTIESNHTPMSPDWKLDVLKQQVKTSIEHLDEYRGILHVRRHLAATPLFKGIANFREHRIAMLRAETADKLFELMEQTRELISEKQ